VLLDDSPREANGDEGDDALESKPRRRGRRGGRRRSAAKAESTASE
jgi:ribonuclease G